jgi:hypothetical protein
MNKPLKELLEIYGEEVVVGRILEQLKLLAFSDDKEVKEAVIAAQNDAGCDTEYIFNLCEYTNLISYASEEVAITTKPWKEN